MKDIYQAFRRNQGTGSCRILAVPLDIFSALLFSEICLLQVIFVYFMVLTSSFPPSPEVSISSIPVYKQTLAGPL